MRHDVGAASVLAADGDRVRGSVMIRRLPDSQGDRNRMSDDFTTDQAAREASGAHPYGRYLEEFEIGAVYKHWPAKTVTETEDHLFCLLTMNHHPLHVNDVYAGASQQGRNVVVGPMVYSLALGMSVSDISGKAIANLQTEELKPPGPGLPRRHAVLRDRGAREARVSKTEARPRHGPRPHPRPQPGRRAGGRVQAPGARAAQGSRDTQGGGRRRVAATTAKDAICEKFRMRMGANFLRLAARTSDEGERPREREARER